MARPDQNQAIGLDPVAWAREGLLDFLIVSQYLRNDYPLPIEDYRALLPEGMPIYGSIEYATRKDAYRHVARQLWENGVDGIYLFNFFASRENSKEPLNDLLHELGDPDSIPAPQLAKGKPLLLVANKHSDTLSYIDPGTLQVLDTIPTGPNPHEMAITPDQRIMYLSNYAPPGNTISVVDIVARKHIKQITTGEYTRIHGATMAADGKHAYFTAGQTGYAVEVDTRTHEVTRAIPTHGKISHMILVSPDNKRLYTANIDTENVSVIDRASGELITRIPCAKGAEGMAFTPNGKLLWVGNQTGGSITIIDVATNTPINTFECTGMPVRLKFIDEGKRVLVPSWTEEGQLIVIDTATLEEVKRIPVGRYAIGVEVTPDEKRAFVGCEHTDGLNVVNLQTLEVEAVIQTGDGPDPMSMWYPPED
jgi:YVTN family beta-propeller protein